MCFGSSRDDRHSAQPRPIELRPRVPRGIQHVETLEELEYVAYPATSNEISGIPGATDYALDFYTIYHVAPGTRVWGEHIALLGASEETGLLVVYEIYTVRDPRDSHDRPRAAAIFLSFWHRYLGLPIEWLRTMRFETVTEDTMRRKRPTIYRLMDRELEDELDIRRRSRSRGEKAAFDLTWNETPFGRCAKLIETKNPAMREAGIKISRFMFHPQDEAGFYFNFVVEFRVL